VKPDVSSDNKRLQALAAGDRRVLEEIYTQYRDEFLRWTASRFGEGDRQDRLDAWHDTVIMFYEQVMDGRLTTLTCALRTYLFTIGNRRMLTFHRKKGRTELREDFNANEYMDETINVDEWVEMDERCYKICMLAVEELPTQSRRILVLRYLEGKELAEILGIMQYRTANAVSVTLSRALATLRNILRKHDCLKRNGR
jgi:RNA polymerase sigma factor (sigma-70 family)